MFQYLSIGPPVYFVVRNSSYDYEHYESQDLIRGGANPSSLVSQIFAASRASNRTFIAKPVSSWVDDYIDWAGNGNCCKYNVTTHDFCPNDVHSRNACRSCNIAMEEGRLTPDDFETYLSFFLKDNPNEDCPKGGHAAYGHAVTYNRDIVSKKSVPGATYFMTYHTILKTSQDYTNALREARKIAANITDTLNSADGGDHEVFPYSIFYVFYEQYLTMWPDTLKGLAISIAAIFVVTFLLTGFDIHAASVVLFTILLILVNLGGLMYHWSISLNAVSLVNLVMVSLNRYLKLVC